MRRSIVSAIAFASLVMSGSALAADLPFKAAPRPVVEPWSWTGLYVGVHIGGGWFVKEQTITAGVPIVIVNENNYSGSGILGGGQVGINYQMGPWVIGAEAQFSAADLDGKNSCMFAVVALLNCRTNVDGIGTIAARLGYASDRTLYYVKGGGAWAHDQYTISSSITPFQTFRVDDTRWGWMFGAGIEHAFYGNWSGKIEYNFLDLGTDTINFPGLFATLGVNEAVDTRQRIHLIKAGVLFFIISAAE